MPNFAAICAGFMPNFEMRIGKQHHFQGLCWDSTMFSPHLANVITVRRNVGPYKTDDCLLPTNFTEITGRKCQESQVPRLQAENKSLQDQSNVPMTDLEVLESNTDSFVRKAFMMICQLLFKIHWYTLENRSESELSMTQKDLFYVMCCLLNFDPSNDLRSTQQLSEQP